MNRSQLVSTIATAANSNNKEERTHMFAKLAAGLVLGCALTFVGTAGLASADDLPGEGNTQTSSLGADQPEATVDFTDIDAQDLDDVADAVDAAASEADDEGDDPEPGEPDPGGSEELMYGLTAPMIKVFRGPNSTYTIGSRQQFCYYVGRVNRIRISDRSAYASAAVVEWTDDGEYSCLMRTVTGPEGAHRLRLELLDRWGRPTGPSAEVRFYVRASMNVPTSAVIFYSEPYFTGAAFAMQSGSQIGLPFLPRSVRFEGAYSYGWAADIRVNICNWSGCSSNLMGTMAGSKVVINWYGQLDPSQITMDLRPY